MLYVPNPFCHPPQCVVLVQYWVLYEFSMGYCLAATFSIFSFVFIIGPYLCYSTTILYVDPIIMCHNCACVIILITKLNNDHQSCNPVQIIVLPSPLLCVARGLWFPLWTDQQSTRAKTKHIHCNSPSYIFPSVCRQSQAMVSHQSHTKYSGNVQSRSTLTLVNQS